jgi:hypothetical protein
VIAPDAVRFASIPEVVEPAVTVTGLVPDGGELDALQATF